MPGAAPWLTPEHDAFRKALRTVVERELAPHADEWEAAGIFPREIFALMGKLGYLGLRFSPDYGGAGLDFWYTLILAEELVKCGSVGTAVGLLAHMEFALSVIDARGTPEQKTEYLAPAIRGEKIAAIGITEPGAGSDVGAIRTTARRTGGDWVINGAKTFITNGTRADFLSLLARTGDPGPRGLSVIIFPTDTKGFRVGKALRKMGAHASDTAELFFDECPVPLRNLVGEEGRGFGYVMDHFKGERLVLSGLALGVMERLWQEGTRYAGERQVFGKPLGQFQAWRHRLADARTTIEAARQLTYWACERLNRDGPDASLAVSMAKLFTAEHVKRVANEVFQLHGGYGYIEESPICRLYRDVAGFTIGAGTSEVMREIIAREAQL
ncbi:MAG: acyl-CoA dehydrogenase family protein [Candidatus Rokubacteria bacterium]|nr:acyl-CoA dehydrogenase family protein [Candidatus Rokubacteria bacterium]